MAILDSLNNAVEAGKLINDISQKLANADLHLQVSNLMTSLAQAQNENARLMDQVRDLKKAAEIEEDLEFDGNIYRRRSKPKHAYCQLCWDKNQLLMHLQPPNNEYAGEWKCVNCGNHFGRQKPIPSQHNVGY